MQFQYSYQTDTDQLSADLLRIVDFLKEHGAEAVSNIVVTCYPWRSGKRLQAVNKDGEIRAIPICREDDPRSKPDATERWEKLTIRERPDELGVTGLATAFNHDD